MSGWVAGMQVDWQQEAGDWRPMPRVTQTEREQTGNQQETQGREKQQKH